MVCPLDCSLCSREITSSAKGIMSCLRSKQSHIEVPPLGAAMGMHRSSPPEEGRSQHPPETASTSQTRSGRATLPLPVGLCSQHTLDQPAYEDCVIPPPRPLKKGKKHEKILKIDINLLTICMVVRKWNSVSRQRLDDRGEPGRNLNLCLPELL